MTFSRTKLMLFHRQDPKFPEHGETYLICIFPDGRIARTTLVSGSNIGARGWKFFDRFFSPCYGTEHGRYKDRWSKYPTPQAAFNTMRKFEKKNNLPKAEFIGTI